MFTHKNTYMDMSVRAYFGNDTIAIGVGASNDTGPSNNDTGPLDFSGWEVISGGGDNQASYTATADDKINSIAIGFGTDTSKSVAERTQQNASEFGRKIHSSEDTYNDLNNAYGSIEIGYAQNNTHPDAQSLRNRQQGNVISIGNSFNRDLNTQHNITRSTEVTGGQNFGNPTRVRGEIKYENEKAKVSIDSSGNLTPETLIPLFGDLDGRGGTEVKNVHWFFRLFGKESQKFTAGEVQLANLLRALGCDRSMQNLQRVYQNVMGTPMPPCKLPSKVKVGDTIDINDLGASAQEAIKNFQQTALQRANTVANIVSMMTKNVFSGENQPGEVRTGLRSVLTGESHILIEKLQNPNNIQKVADYIREDETIKDKEGFFNKILATLATIGINIPIWVASGGLLSVDYDTKNISTKRGEKSNDFWDLSGSYSLNRARNNKDQNSFDPNNPITGGGSLVGDFNLISVRGGVTISSARERMRQRRIIMDNMIASGQYDKLTTQLIQEVNTQFTGKSNEKVRKLNQNFIESQRAIANIQGVDEQAKRDTLFKNAMIYLGKAEEIYGVSFADVSMILNPFGVSIGAGFEKTVVRASSDGVYKSSGILSAEILKKFRLLPGELQEKLSANNIVQGSDGGYRQNGAMMYGVGGKPLIETLNEKVIFKVIENYGVEAGYYYIEGRVVPKNSKQTHQIQRINRNNPYLRENPELMGDIMYGIRQSNAQKYLVTMQKYIQQGNWDEAKRIGLNRVFVSKNRDIQIVRSKLSSLEGQALQDYLSALNIFTSGGKSKGSSRDLADKIRNEKANIDKQLKNLYSRGVANSFAKQYGLEKSTVMSLLSKMTGDGLDISDDYNVGDRFKTTGYTGVVAYSQLNKGGTTRGYRGLTQTNYSNTEAIGEMVQVKGNDAEILRAAVRKNLLKQDLTYTIQHIKESNPHFATVSDNMIRDAITGGEVYTYLSFAKGAECFNLGVAIKPKGFTYMLPNTAVSYKGIGDTLGYEVIENSRYGIYAGVRWGNDGEGNKGEGNDSTTHTGSEEVTNATTHTASETAATTGTAQVIDTTNVVTSDLGSAASEAVQGAAIDLSTNAVDEVTKITTINLGG